MKIEIDRELLHQMMRGLMPDAPHRDQGRFPRILVEDTARRIADATAGSGNSVVLDFTSGEG